MPGTNLNAKYGGDTVIATDFYNDNHHLPKYVKERDERREDPEPDHCCGESCTRVE
jgi:hypothetical protein